MDFLRIDNNATLHPRAQGGDSESTSPSSSLLSPRTIPPTSDGVMSLTRGQQHPMPPNNLNPSLHEHGYPNDMQPSPEIEFDSDLFLNLAQDGPALRRADTTTDRPNHNYSRRRRLSDRANNTSERPASSHQRDPARRDFAPPSRHASLPPEPNFVPSRRLPAAPSALHAQSLGIGEDARTPAELRIANYRSRYQPTPQSPSITSFHPLGPLPDRRVSLNEALYASSRSQNPRPSRLAQLARRDSDQASQYSGSGDRTANLRAEYTFDGAESTVSAAPSVMWDELNELKARIQKMEAGERSSMSRGTASNESADRPRTASTALTTMSSSPKHAQRSDKNTTNSASTVKASVENNHPMLHQSLERCRETLGTSSLRTLESVVQEALDLASLAAGESHQSSGASTVNGGMMDRQLRRKTDNLCRGLTDLCIALYEDRSSSAQAAPMPRDRRMSQDLLAKAITLRPDTALQSQHNGRVETFDAETVEPLRSSPSRALERVKQRRASTMALQSNLDDSEYIPDNRGPSTSPSQAPMSRASRLTAALRQPSTRRYGNESIDLSQDSSSLRPASRAFTEIGSSASKSRRNRLSGNYAALRTPDREYTSNHPLPTASGPSSLQLRRVTGDIRQSATNSPEPGSTPGGRDLFRRFLEQNPHVASSPLADPQDREAKRRSLGLYTASGATRLGGPSERRTSLSRGGGVPTRGMVNGSSGE